MEREKKREREGERALPVKVVSHPRRVYRDHSVSPYARQLPVPTVEDLSMGLELFDPEEYVLTETASLSYQSRELPQIKGHRRVRGRVAVIVLQVGISDERKKPP